MGIKKKVLGVAAIAAIATIKAGATTLHKHGYDKKALMLLRGFANRVATEAYKVEKAADRRIRSASAKKAKPKAKPKPKKKR
ncbi:hypothetical protein JW711_02635 [Candidatus Woesearchaeota archaeon]|nr:hypothetical protein [Candidatus Woesearchaeota archaeon]